MRRRLAAGLVAGLAVAAVAGLGFAQEAPQTLPPPPAPDQNTTAQAPPEEAPPPPPIADVPPPPVTPKAAPPPAKPPEPLRRTRNDAAILQATDKITAETLRFEARVGQPVRFKDLVITVRACETTAADEAVADSIASLDVVSQPVSAVSRAAMQPRPVFRGWMFANSPSLHPFEHPVYDLTLIACRTTSAPASAAKP